LGLLLLLTGLVYKGCKFGSSFWVNLLEPNLEKITSLPNLAFNLRPWGTVYLGKEEGKLCGVPLLGFITDFHWH